MKHYAIIITILALGAVTLRAQDTTVTVPALPRPEPLPVLFQKHRPVNDYSGLRSLLRRLAHPKWDGRDAEPDTLEYLPSFEALRDAGEPMTPEELSEALMPATRFARNMDKTLSDADGSVKDHFLSMARGETPVGPPVYRRRRRDGVLPRAPCPHHRSGGFRDGDTRQERGPGTGQGGADSVPAQAERRAGRQDRHRLRGRHGGAGAAGGEPELPDGTVPEMTTHAADISDVKRINSMDI